VIELSRSSN